MLKTKHELATELYPDVSFDTALPQAWVNDAAEIGFDVRPHFVWGYRPGGSIFGEPLPLTPYAHKFLTAVAWLGWPGAGADCA